MTYLSPGVGALDYQPCRYGTSKLLFRGPQRALDRPFCAFLGGTETYGKFVPRPFPDLVAEAAHLRAVNLGCVNAGADVYLNDPSLLEIAAGAEVTVVQVMGAQNLSNRFYTVHPRRNDRFLRASLPLQALFPTVEFTDFHFTRHMLQVLRATSEEGFLRVVEELRNAWVARMRSLLDRIESRTMLLWLGAQPPAAAGAAPDLGADPILVDAAMMAALRSHADAYLEVVSSRQALAEGAAGLSFAPEERLAAQEVPGQAVHSEVAQALAPRLRAMM